MLPITLVAPFVLASLTTATPVRIEKHTSNKFSLEQNPHKTILKNGPEENIKMLRKYGRPVPNKIIAAAKRLNNFKTANSTSKSRHRTKKADTGSASADPIDYWDTAYLTPITVGNETLNLIFDTGSSDLWVFSSLQSSDQMSGHDYYQVNPANQLQGATWDVTYGEGSEASGTVYTDAVTIGGVTVTAQAVEAAESVSATFQETTEQDGILGLGFSNANTVRPSAQKSWFDNADLEQHLFAVTLKHQAPGSYDFGYIDSSKYTGAITYVDVDSSNGWWQFSASGYTVGSTTTSASINGIADTGTSLFYLDGSIVDAYYAQVSGSQNSEDYGAYIFPCSASLPDFSVIIGGTSHTVPGNFLNYAQVDSNNCYGGLQSNAGIGFSIFGGIFFKGQYVVFRSGSSNSIGFARQAGL